MYIVRVTHGQMGQQPGSFNTKQTIKILFLLTILIGFAVIYNLHGTVKLLTIQTNGNQEPSLTSSAVAEKNLRYFPCDIGSHFKQLDPENCCRISIHPWVQFCSFSKQKNVPMTLGSAIITRTHSILMLHLMILIHFFSIGGM